MGRCVYEIPLHFMLTTAVLVMMVMVARMMMMTLVTVVGAVVGMMMMTLVTVVGAVVEGDVCAHEQAICQTAHVITTTVTHCASTNHTFYTLVQALAGSLTVATRIFFFFKNNSFCLRPFKHSMQRTFCEEPKSPRVQTEIYETVTKGASASSALT